MAKMHFHLDTSEKPTKISLGMYSKENEYVAFSKPCDCSGQVMWSPVSSLCLSFSSICIQRICIQRVSISPQGGLFDPGSELLSVLWVSQFPLTWSNLGAASSACFLLSGKDMCQFIYLLQPRACTERNQIHTNSSLSQWDKEFKWLAVLGDLTWQPWSTSYGIQEHQHLQEKMPFKINHFSEMSLLCTHLPARVISFHSPTPWWVNYHLFPRTTPSKSSVYNSTNTKYRQLSP